jgi:alpha-tubulin suppressor-like RCC1 family protein
VIAGSFVEIRAAELHTCGRKTDGTLWCWGHNENGQLGNSSNTSSLTPVQVSGLANVTLFDGGRTHTCAVGSVGSVQGLWCWGRGGERQPRAANQATGKLGNGSSADSNVPVKVDLSAAAAQGQTVRSLATGSYHSCVVMSDDKTWCWGRNSDGELGDGSTTPSNVPVEVSYGGITIGNGVTVEQVSCSDGRRKQSSTCIRLSDGVVYCWGGNTHGELGDGTTTARSAPAAPVDQSAMGGVKIVQLVAAQFAKCARTDDGAVWCWGMNQNGILGINDATTANQVTPVKANTSGVTALDMSHHLACAIDSAKQLYCWGTNMRGQATMHTPATPEEGAVLQPTQLAF